MNPYRDKRQEFFASHFQKALPYEQYVGTGTTDEQARWREFERHTSATPTDREILATFRRKMNTIVLSGTWCGDCARQGPMLHALEQEAPTLAFRFIDNRSNPELQDELRINGAEKVPTIVVLSEDFYEVSRWGDRHLTVYRRKAATELGTACDPGILPPPGAELTAEFTEWVHFFERLELLLRLAPALRRRYGD